MRKVLYIAGAGRSGSTLLARVLRTAGESVLAPGELIDLWHEGFIENRICECGTRFDECGFWREVVDRAGIDRAAAVEMLTAQSDLARTRHLPRMMLTRGRSAARPRQPRYVRVLAALYAALFNSSGAQMVVDGSKSPAYASVLKAVPGLEVYIIHIVRDPRGVAWSWAKRRINPSSGKSFGRMSFPKSALLWTTWNIATTMLHEGRNSGDRYLRIRYEDLVADPASSVQRILLFVGATTRSLPTRNDEGAPVLSIDQHHSIGGNPVKFSDSMTVFQADTAWRREMPLWGRSFVTALTWPLLIRFGYPLLPGSDV